MRNDSKIFDLTELCDLAGVTPRTVRYYVQRGLLPSPGQTGPGAKYNEGHLGRLRLIRKLQREHLPLAEIRRQLDTMDDEAVLTSLGSVKGAAQGESALEYIQSLKGSKSTGVTRREPSLQDRRGGFPRERSQWERLSITEDIEIHVRRPLSRFDNRQLEELIRVASTLFEEE